MGKSWSELLREKLREHMNNKADDLATGCAGDYPDYKFRVGVIEGLAIAEREFLDIIERIEKDG